MKRILSLSLCLALLLGMVAGCAKEPEQTDPSTQASETKPRETQPSEPEQLPKPETITDLLAMEGKDGYYFRAAEFAVNDILNNYWIEDENGAHFVRTHGGFYNPDIPKGAIWETAMLAYTVYDMWVLTGDDSYKQILQQEAAYFKNTYFDWQLEDPKGPSGPSSDDCAWSSMLYLCFYEVTRDDWFAYRAMRLLDNAYDRWYDESLGNLRYNDLNNGSSLYECGMTMSWLRIWELTGVQKYYDLAFQSYTNLHNNMIHPDGIYFNDYFGTPRQPEEMRMQVAGSASSLFGNMAMAALSARFYKITGEQVYLDRVHATNAGIAKWYDSDGDGVLMNDRDAWTNGSFASYYASHVLTLEGTEEMRELLKSTVRSMMRHARNADGYYGAAWLEGDCRWHLAGETDNDYKDMWLQSKTNGSTVLFITAAAILEAKIDDFTR